MTSRKIKSVDTRHGKIEAKMALGGANEVYSQSPEHIPLKSASLLYVKKVKKKSKQKNILMWNCTVEAKCEVQSVKN